ncbi:hypothetical protein FEM03_15440 [Phragmitibacter flavus]|uniref:B box-type domain-containing protein n=1 Tax=Phragmitibacter flavus TaxID=2576071 RepID=A0A5R8KBP0_9BACT|nr:hypothetical protein [Phragmitibacter flavus]TLD69720.1 hypothetical protein FEM03_15440 [Phragmitibacter flavus]
MAQVQCLNHPKREAAARCTACAQVFCRECVTSLEGKMVCGACYREKTTVEAVAKKDWYLLTVAMQVVMGMGLLWLMSWLVGKWLAEMPAAFHEGTMWETFGKG